MIRKFSAALALATMLLLPVPGHTWEGTTTHAGLTEQAALHSDLHIRLQKLFGLEEGLLGTLEVPRKDAKALFAVLDRVNPTHGFRPDSRGRMSALSWLVAGAALADTPLSAASQHFWSPFPKAKAPDNESIPASVRLSHWSTGSRMEKGFRWGRAIDYWHAPSNARGYVGYAEQFRLAVTAPTPAERNRHLAGALLAAGTMLHVLQDMGSPSHVRADFRAHFQQVGAVPSDRASRFERVAALAFGRLGIPGPNQEIELQDLQSHFFHFAPKGSEKASVGLAEWSAREFFSINTLPPPTLARRNDDPNKVLARVQRKALYPAPLPAGPLDIVAAKNAAGATLRNQRGTCLARYRWERSELRWSTDDECRLEQLEEILPLVAAYGASFLTHLFSDELKLEKSASGISLSGLPKLPGTLTLVQEDEQGARKAYKAIKIRGNEGALALPLPGAPSSAVVALFESDFVKVRKTAIPPSKEPAIPSIPLLRARRIEL